MLVGLVLQLPHKPVAQESLLVPLVVPSLMAPLAKVVLRVPAVGGFAWPWVLSGVIAFCASCEGP